MAEHLSSMDKALGYIPTPQMDELRDEWTDGWMDGQTEMPAQDYPLLPCPQAEAA